MSKADQLAAVLDEFLSVSLDVEAAAVVSSDGLPMASALPPDVEEDRLAAMSAALLSLGERAAIGTGQGRSRAGVHRGHGRQRRSDGRREACGSRGDDGKARQGRPRSLRDAQQCTTSRAGVRRARDPRTGTTVVTMPCRDTASIRLRLHPPEPSPYTAVAEDEQARPSWEDQTIQDTPDWEAQPVESTDWADQPEGNLESEPWGQEQVDQPKETARHSIDEPDQGHEVGDQGHEANEQWSQQQEGAQKEEFPKQRDDDQQDENSSFTSW